MIGMRTILEVADNSGARKLRAFCRAAATSGLRAGLGDVVTASVKEAAPDSAIKKGKVVRCVIVRMRKETRRKDGTYIRFDSNAAVLINEVGEPVGTRVFGPVAANCATSAHEDRFAGAGGDLMPAKKERQAGKAGSHFDQEERQVKVIAGRDKGKTGRVLDVTAPTASMMVEGTSMIKRHTRPNPQADQGRHRGAESPIAISNVMIVCLGRRAGAHRHMWTEAGGKPAAHVRIAASAARRWTRRPRKA
jgi:large subunit ribosomal protein L14